MCKHDCLAVSLIVVHQNCCVTQLYFTDSDVVYLFHQNQTENVHFVSTDYNRLPGVCEHTGNLNPSTAEFSF